MSCHKWRHWRGRMARCSQSPARRRSRARGTCSGRNSSAWCTARTWTRQTSWTPHRSPEYYVDRYLHKIQKCIIILLYIYEETLLHFHFNFGLWILVSGLSRHVHVDVDWEIRQKFHWSHSRFFGYINLNLKTPTESGEKDLESGDILNIFRWEFQFLSIYKLYVCIPNDWKLAKL